VNLFVKLYKQGLKNKLPSESREFHYRIAASMISSFGTIEDLKALDKYYEYEREETKNEKIKVNQLKIS